MPTKLQTFLLYGLTLFGLAVFLASQGAAATPASKSRPPLPLLSQSPFVTADRSHFIRNGIDYDFVGANFWYGMNLASKGKGGDRPRMIRELTRLYQLGITHLRILGLSQGAAADTPGQIVPALETSQGRYDENLLEGLDFLLSEMKKRDMTATIILGNYWPWSGGMEQYLQWSHQWLLLSWLPNAEGFYYDRNAQAMYERDVQMLILRYRNDPTIMSWELANEPRPGHLPAMFHAWIDRTSRFIKSLDPNHLVTTGCESLTELISKRSFNAIDYATLHVWAQNVGWYDPHRAQETYPSALARAEDLINTNVNLASQIEKPIVIEEFGLARDDEHYEPQTPVTYRDSYYEAIFNQVADLISQGRPLSGVSFWAWAGEGVPPTRADHRWKEGDAFLGDPPHEPQGWYSVYASDASTLRIIREASEKIKHSRQRE